MGDLEEFSTVEKHKTPITLYLIFHSFLQCKHFQEGSGESEFILVPLTAGSVAWVEHILNAQRMCWMNN